MRVALERVAPHRYRRRQLQGIHSTRPNGVAEAVAVALGVALGLGVLVAVGVALAVGVAVKREYTTKKRNHPIS